MLYPTTYFDRSNPVIGNKQKGETLYLLGEYPDWKWVELGDNKKAIKSIDKGLSYDSENIELIELVKHRIKPWYVCK